MSTETARSYTPPLSPRRAALPDVAPRRGLYRVMTFVLRSLFRLVLDVRVEQHDQLPSSGPVLIAGNHRSFLDAPLVIGFVSRQACFLAKSELFQGPAARLLMSLGQIPVDRGRPDRAALRRAVAVLQGGGVLGMFPEGARGAGSLDTVQHGIAYIALRVPGVPIVPVACLGTERAMPKGARFPRWGSRVDVMFGQPFTISVPESSRSRSAVARAAEEIRVALAAHVAHAEATRAAEEHGRVRRWRR